MLIPNSLQDVFKLQTGVQVLYNWIIITYTFTVKKKFYKCKIKSNCSVFNQFRFPKKKATENITVYIKLPFYPLLVIINKTFREGKNKMGDNILEMLVEKVKTT